MSLEEGEGAQVWWGEGHWKSKIWAILWGFFLASLSSTSLYYWIFPKEAFLSKDKKWVSSFNQYAWPESLTLEETQEILLRNLFNWDGKLPDEDQLRFSGKSPSLSESMPLSQLSYKIVGLIYGDSPEEGVAVLQHLQTKAVKAFPVKSFIQPGTQLIALENFRAIFLRGDSKEYLPLPDFQLSFGRRSVKRPQVQKVSSPETPLAYKEEGFERTGSQIVMSEEYRQKLLGSDFSRVLQDAKAEPYMEGNSLAGFKITRIKEDSIYQKSGLLDEDIIKEINGVSLVDTAQAIRLLNSLRGEKDIELKIQRGGLPMTMNLTVR